MPLKLYLLLPFLVLVACGNVLAQNQVITGRVTSGMDNSPLPGVTVLLKGTSTGTATDADGSYRLEVPSRTGTLVFSFIGYVTEETPIDNRTRIDVALVSDVKALTEVVVVGYGTQERRDITGAVASVKSKEIENIPVASTDALLQGRAAGVQVVQNSGTPGGGVTVRVRGTTSINAGNDPLYIVDGVPVSAGNLSSVYRGSQTNALADINPNDIESMEVLKDASASAIYGARAANGVVLITTKRGKSGKPSFSFNYYTGLQNDIKSRRPDKLNNIEFIELINEQRANALSSGVPSLYAFVIPDSGTVVNTDWLEEILRPAPISNYDLSVRGGTDKIRYSVSAGYFDQDGIITNSGFKRLSSRVNIDYDASPKFKIGNSLSLSRSISNRITLDESDRSIMRAAIFKTVVMPVYNADGTYFLDDASGTINPVAYAKEVDYKTANNRLIGNIYADYTFLPGLTFRTTWGVDFAAIKDDYFQPSIALRGGATEGEAAYTQNLTWINENLLTYSKTFAERHKFTALLGYSQQETTEEQIRSLAIGYSTDNIATLNGAATPQVSTSFNSAAGIASLFSRVNYILNDKYLIEGSIRRDGSSRFGRNKKYAFFPAVSVGWRLSGESFMQSLPFITDLKLRASVGKTGNQNLGDFRSQGVYTVNNSYLGQGGVAPSDLPNPDLTWESTTQYNAGLDASFFNSRVNVIFDAYLKQTNDLLLDVRLPGTAGLNSSIQNVGSTENRGIELNVTSRNLTEAFTWTTNFNIGLNRNKVTKLYQEGQEIVFSRGTTSGFGNSLPLSVLRVGDPIGAFYGWHNLGIYANSGDNPNGLRNDNVNGYLFRGGDIIFQDTNGDNIIDNNDRAVIGSAQPKFFGGLTNVFGYKGFELSVLAQYSYGNDIYNASRAFIESMTQFSGASKNVLRRWRQEGDVTDIPRADHNDPGNNRRSSERWLEDGSYLRFKTVTLSYNFPALWVQKIKLQSLRLYVTGQNLYTFTNYSGFDPEASAFNSRATDLGIDYGTYPQSRTFLVGVNIGF